VKPQRVWAHNANLQHVTNRARFIRAQDAMHSVASVLAALLLLAPAVHLAAATRGGDDDDSRGRHQSRRLSIIDTDIEDLEASSAGSSAGGTVTITGR
jgi:hypothetical protein